MRDEQIALAAIFGMSCYSLSKTAPSLHVSAFDDRDLTEIEEELDVALSALLPLKDSLAAQRRSLERRRVDNLLAAGSPVVPAFP